MIEATLNCCLVNGHVGDVNPFFWRGRYHAFHLLSPGAGITGSLDRAYVVSEDDWGVQGSGAAVENGFRSACSSIAERRRA